MICVCVDSRALYRAANEGDLEEVKRLLKKGVPPDRYRQKDWYNTTTLQRAAFSNHPHIVKALIDAGSDVEIKDDNENNALHDSCRKGYDKVVTVLLDANAKINATNYLKSTPLLLACKASHPSTALLLIQRGADVTKINANKISPLHYASEAGNLTIVQYLVEKTDAVKCLDMKSVSGKTPLDLAKRNGHKDVEDYLEQFTGTVIDANEGNHKLCTL